MGRVAFFGIYIERGGSNLDNFLAIFRLSCGFFGSKMLVWLTSNIDLLSWCCLVNLSISENPVSHSALHTEVDLFSTPTMGVRSGCFQTKPCL